MKIVFLGTPQAAVPSLERIVADSHDVVEVWTQPDRPAGRGKKLTAPPVKLSAESFGLPVFQPLKIKTKSTRARFVGLAADIAVVVAYGRILSRTYLESYPKGCINVHFSLLPKYRGAAPVNWAIANGETKTGVTTMRMDAGLDTGDILLAKETDILSAETAPELMDRLSVIGAELLSETLARFDEIEPRKQKEAEATYAPLFEKEDGRIGWDAEAKAIVDRIRGFQPFPRSFSMVNGQLMTFWKGADALVRTDQMPGKVLVADNGELLIACGGGTVLRAIEIQAAGKPRMSARDFLNGDRVKAGDTFVYERSI